MTSQDPQADADEIPERERRLAGTIYAVLASYLDSLDQALDVTRWIMAMVAAEYRDQDRIVEHRCGEGV